MPSGIAQLGLQTLGTAVNTGMGLLLEKHNDKRQLRQQGKLQELQIQGDKEMSDYNYSKQLQMWKDTNYKAQQAELEKAGLNPGLIYGMSGGGATTTGSGGGNVTGGTAPSGGREVVDMQAMGLQRGLQEAQINNINADTEKKKVETAKTSGVDTELATTQVASISQGIKNAEVQNSILKWEDNIKRIDSNVAEQTQGDRMGQIRSLAETAASTAEMIERDNGIAAETKNEKITQIKAESIGAVIRNELTNAQIDKTGMDIKKTATEITNMVVNMGVEWAKLSIDQQKLKLQEKLVNFNTAQSQRTYENILKGINTITGSLKPGTTINQAPKETIINNY
ncbi:MAG: DNA pilot protein [Microviridae sp.]|nr:MAG: DNA pilot protein [Microviridae sp.]